MEYLSAKKGSKQQKHPILFLHGAYCDSSVWEDHFLEYFSEKGFDCYTIDFTDTSSIFGLPPVSLESYVAQTIDTIKKIGGTPILIGHSMAGAVMNRLYQKTKMNFPGWVQMAPVPPRNFHSSSTQMLLSDPILFSQMYLLQMLGKSFVSPNLAKHALFSDEFDDKKAYAYLQNIKSTPNSVIFDVMLTCIPKSDLQVDFPVLLQAGKHDRLVSSSNIDTTADTFNVKPKYYNSGHALMADNAWQEVADDIVEWIENKVK